MRSHSRLDHGSKNRQVVDLMTEDTTPELRRSFKPQWVFAIALGSAVGWGAFILPFDWMTTGGLGGTVIGFLVGGSMIAVIALSYGAVIRALPVTGGGVAFAYAALGRTHAFIAGCCLTLGYAGIVALNASATALVFRVTLPGLIMQGKLYLISGWDIYLPEVIIPSIVLVVFAWINIRGVELCGALQYVCMHTDVGSCRIDHCCGSDHVVHQRSPCSGLPSRRHSHCCDSDNRCLCPMGIRGIRQCSAIGRRVQLLTEKGSSL